jgi:hypothetical protein
VIHRDLKPENILLTDNGGIKVIDFGIAQFLTEGQTEEQAGRLIGTPIYMSPEQKNDPESTSYPSDIYSLGIILYELVLGKLSHGRIHLSIMPKGLQKILSKCLQPRAEDRYQDIVDFMTDLSAYLHSPSLLKENKELDPLSELSESLRQAQATLIPQDPPDWPPIEIGLATYKKMGASSLYFDFVKLPDQEFGVLIGDCSVKGSPGIFYTTLLRGMARALCKLTNHPQELATVLNSLLLEDNIGYRFPFCYLILSPHKNQCRFISCGCGQLFTFTNDSQGFLSIPCQNPLLGIEPHLELKQIEQDWKEGEMLLLETVFGPTQSPESLISPFLLERADIKINQTMPQRLADDLIRSIKIRLSQSKEEKSVVILSFQRGSYF